MSPRCSFCLRPAEEVAKLIAGPGSYICDRCVGAAVQILDHPSSSESAGPDLPSWTTLPDEALLARLPAIAAAAGQVESALAQWVSEARRRGASWARVGAVLGITRQAAWVRFNRD